MRGLWDRKFLPVVGYLILTLGVAFTFAHQEWARKERVEQLNLINTAQCQEIESLKSARREEANENYGNLARNAKLLGIKVTPELRDRALKDRNNTLERFKEGTCPRKKIK